MEMMGRKKKNIRWNTMGILAGGFLGVILLGGIFLWMPFSNRQPIEFMDALFTSVSAVCNRACDNHSGSTVYGSRTDDFTCADPDWRSWSDCLRDSIFLTFEKKNHAEGTDCDPRDI